MAASPSTSLSRRAALLARLAETWLHRPPSPTRAVIDLTRRCNLRCRMCKTWTLPPRPELAPEEIGRLVADMPRLCWLDLTGGEPTCRRDFVDVLGAVARAGEALHVLHFQTNGWLRARAVEAVRSWRALRPDVELIVTVSLDGPRPVHDAMRGRPGAFDRALATLRALRAIADVDVHVGTTITAANATSFEALGDVLAAAIPGFDLARWHINVVQRSQHFFANAQEFDALRVDASASVERHIARRGSPRDLVGVMEHAYLVNLAAVQRGEPSGIACQALRSTVFVSPEGDVYPCHLWDRRLGNVRDIDFATLWRSAAVARARHDVEALRCGGCFSACEAYPALAGSPVAAVRKTLSRMVARHRLSVIA